MNNLGGFEKMGIASVAILLVMGIALNLPFLTVIALVGGGVILASKGMLGAVKSSEASKPLQERLGTIVERTQTVYQQQHYKVQFEDNGETIGIMAHEGEGPMHLQAGDYGLLSVRGHTLYAFEPRKKGISDEAVTINANTLFADQITDWVDMDNDNGSN